MERRLLKEVMSNIHDTVGVKLTEAQAIEFLVEFNSVGEIIDWGEVDSELRERLVDALTIKLLNTRWPGNSYSEEYRSEFIKKFDEAAVKAGYEVVKFTPILQPSYLQPV